MGGTGSLLLRYLTLEEDDWHFDIMAR